MITFNLLTGTSNPFNGIDVGDLESRSTPSLVDLDGDGDLDLVVGESSGAVNYYRNTGTATAPVYAEQTGTNNPFLGLETAFGTLASNPTLGDVDGDGDLDLLLGNFNGTVDYYRNTGNATAPAFAMQLGTNNPFRSVSMPEDRSAPTLGDIDGDRDLDLLVADSRGFLFYYRNNGTPTAPAFARQSGTDNPLSEFFLTNNDSTISLVDFDGDRDLDLVTGNIFGVLNYYLNTGTATAVSFAEQSGTDNPFHAVRVLFYSAPSLGDIDGDGDLDVVSGEIYGTVLNFINNDAPTLSQASFNLTATDENTDITPVTTASLLASAGWDDVDLGALQGLAITGSTGAGWQYSVDGSTWTPIGAASATAAVLLAQGTQLRYAPDRANGETATLSFRAWDQSSGTASTDTAPSTADTTTNGGTTAFSTDSSTASLVVSAVNDAPTLSTTAFNLTGTNEDTDSVPVTVASLLASAGWADVDAGAQQGLAITGSTGSGWQYSVGGSTWTPVGAASATAAMLLGAGTQLRYAPDRIKGETATLSFRAWDQVTGTASTDETARTANTTTNGGSTAFSSASSTASLVVTSVNDPPVFVAPLFTIDEDTSFSATASALLAASSDPDGDVLSINSIPIYPDLTGLSLAGFTPDQTGRNVSRVLFVPRSNFDGSITFTFSVSDGTVSVPGSITVDILPINDAPAVDAAVLTLSEGQTVTLSAANFTVVDPDNSSFTFSVSGLAGGFFQLSTAPGTPVTTFTSADLSAGLVQFVDDGNEVAPAFSITANDGELSSNTRAAAISYTPVNDAPTTSPVTLPAMAEDSGTRTITQALLLAQAFDADGPALKAENLQISGGLGNLVDNGNGSWNFTPAANDDTSVSFSYRISDGTDTVAGTATLDLTPANDAPRAFNDSAQTSLNAAVSIAVVANDIDVDGDALRVTSTSPGSNGTVAIRPDGVSVRYTPNNGFIGFDSFTYAVADPTGISATASVRVLVASIIGSNGNDTTLGTQQVDFVLGLDGADRILTHDGADYVDAGRGADTITGGAGADTLLGGDGPDTFLATSVELAGDEIDGGDGTDVLVITNAPASLPANFSFTNLEQISFTGALLVEHTSLLDLSSLTLASGSSNSIIGGAANSRITGTASADNMTDSAGNDDLRGAAGNDTIQGGFGQDTLHGGTGNDVLYGGTDTSADDFVRDIFVFNTPLSATTNVDQIIGFQANSQDRIQLDTSIFSAITGGATSGLDADEFRSAAGGNALDGNNFILFDPATGNLFYDADGNGIGAKVLFATLVGLTGTLDATDFVAPVP